jgi:hypothetical protein
MRDPHELTRGFVVLMLALAGAGQVRAQPRPAAVRVSEQNHRGRVVFDFTRHVGFGLQRVGDTVELRFTHGGVVTSVEQGTRNVTAVHGGIARATIDLTPGARLRTRRQGNRIVVDVMDPVGEPPPAEPGQNASPENVPPPNASPQSAPPQNAQQDAPQNAPLQKSAQILTQPPPASAAAPVAPAAPPVAAPSIPVAQTPLPAPDSSTTPAPAAAAPPAPAPAESDALAATPFDLPPGATGSAVLLPFGARVGAAAFRRGGAAWVVFDERRPIDMAALKDDPVLSGATVQLLTAATLLRLPLAAGAELRLSRVPEGWTVAAMPLAPPLSPIPVVAKETRFELPVVNPGQVVVVPDTETGQNLLVGTLRGTLAGIPAARTVPEFVLRATWQGVLVEPISDFTALRATQDGFVVETGKDTLSPQPDTARALAEAAYLTRRFEFPSGATETLLRRLHTQIADDANAPAQSRSRPRKAAAATMIALGLGVEAQALLRLAGEEDPRLANDPEAIGLSAIAAMEGGRDAEADGIADPALNGTDEVALWRAVRAARRQEGSSEAAAAFATTLPLILAYPPELRTRLLPLAAETMAQGGAPDAADALLARLPDDASLDYARALRLEAKGDSAGALKRYDTLAMGRDRLTSARAMTRATLLRLKTKAIGPAEAASALERQFLNWRGDKRELDLRIRVASLRTQAGAWRAAFDLLRETEAMYPDDTAMIDARMADLLNGLMTGPAAAKIAPLDLVALASENAELVASVAPTQAAGLLADKLVALDLPRRAGPVLERMLRAAPVGPAQAKLGARLAALRLGEGDDAGAQDALANSNAPDLPPDLIERRGLLAARAAAHRGDTAHAVSILSDIGTAAADGLRASILTDAKDWPGAVGAFRDLVAKTVPPQGALNPAQQDTLLQLAGALSRAGDDAGLQALGVQEMPRMAGPRVDMFRLLTAAPLSGVSDLGRSSAEIALVRAIPTGLAAIGAK